MRPSGTSTSTTGWVKAKGNAAYTASLSSIATLVIRFSMSTQGSSSYNVTRETTAVQPRSARVTSSRTPIPGNRVRREAMRVAAAISRVAGVRSVSRSPLVQSALRPPPVTSNS